MIEADDDLCFCDLCKKWQVFYHVEHVTCCWLVLEVAVGIGRADRYGEIMAFVVTSGGKRPSYL